MELQFNKTAVRALGTAAQEVKNAELTQEVRLSDGMPDIGRMLATWGQVILRSKEWRGDSVSVSGGVMVWALYAPEDGTEPRCIDTWIPFQLKWDIRETGKEGPVRILPLLRFADSRSVSARKVMVRVGVAAMGQALYPMEASVFRPGELPEDVELLKKTYPVRVPKEAGEKTFVLDEDVAMPESEPGIEKLLSFSVRPEVSDQKVMADKVVFKGTANLHLVYRCPEGKVHSRDFELPFSQFGELENSYGNDAQADVQIGVTSLEADRNEPDKIRVKCGMVGQYLVDDRELLELTRDAYSPFREVALETEQLNLPVILEDRRETVTAEQQVPGQNGQAVDVNYLPDFPRQRRSADGIELELPALFQMLICAEDGSLQSANVRWEGNVNLPADEDSRVSVTVQPTGRPQVMPGMEGSGVIGQMQLHYVTTTDQGIPMVTGLQLGELREPDPGRPSLILCRMGEEGLWDIAKRCGSTVEAIQTANGLQADPEGNQILLIPVS